MPTRLRAFFAAALALLFGATLAAAPTADEVDAGARRAGKGLKAVVRKLASDRFGGRNNGSEGSLLAQELLVKKLRKFADGLAPGGSYLQPFTRNTVSGTNVLAVIPGRELPDEYVIIGAHYDHLGVTCEATASDPGDIICNGATDNASGSAAVLAVGKALAKLKEPPRRSVVLALWDAEEDGLQGSQHYVQSDPLVPLAATVTYVNLDLLGATLIPSLANNTFAIGGETGGTALRELVAEAASHHTVDLTPLSYPFGQGRSDYFPFGEAGVPVVFFGDSSSACYHTAGDEIARVDFAKLAEQTALAFRTVVGVAETETPPAFVAPAAGPSYEDAVALAGLIALSVPADLDLFPPPARAEIEDLAALIEQVAAEGPDAYDGADAVAVIATAAVLIRHLEALPCPAW
jgi:Peptidase family M28